MEAAQEDAETRGKLPGDEGVWFFILADMSLFAALFGSFSYQRSLDVVSFNDSQSLLSPSIAALNTCFLLTSSWLVALAVRAGRRLEPVRAARCIAGAAILGASFVGTKTLEYVLEVRGGATPLTSDFFMYYFIVTGMHLFHVIGGVIVLGIIWSRLRRPSAAHRSQVLLESGASFWHMVDLLWLMIFPIFYLLN